MKKVIIYIGVAAIAITLLLSVGLATNKSKLAGLSGCIEIVSDYGIERVCLPSGRTEAVLNKSPEYLVGTFDVSHDGTERVLAVLGYGGKPERLIYLRNKSLKTILPKNFVRCPSFSPDSEYVAYLYHEYDGKTQNWVDDMFLYVIMPDGSSHRQVSKLSLNQHKPSWFPDRKRLALGTKDMKIVIVDIETGRERKIIDFGIAPTVSNDGKKIAYLSKEVEDSIKAKMVESRNLSKEHYEKFKMGRQGTSEEIEFSKLFLHYSIYIYDMETGQSMKMTDELSIEKPVLWSADDKHLLYNDEKSLGHEVYALHIETREKAKIEGVNGELMAWVQ